MGIHNPMDGIGFIRLMKDKDKIECSPLPFTVKRSMRRVHLQRKGDEGVRKIVAVMLKKTTFFLLLKEKA